MRTLAAFSVILGHFAVHLKNTQPLEYLNSFIGAAYGVELFFVLSGFLIGGILIREFQKDQPTAGALKRFWYRRWMRTLPVYFVYLAAYYFVFPNGEKVNIFQYAVFMQNFLWMPEIPFFGHSWSLTIEELFYLTVPLAFVVVVALTGPLTRRTALVAILGYIALAIGCKFGGLLLDDFTYREVKKIAFFRLDAIGYGVLIAYILQFYPKLFKRIASLSVLCFVPFLLYSALNSVPGFMRSEPAQALRFILVPICLAITIPWFYSLRPIEGIFSRFVTFTSKISYSMYLSHILVIFLANRIFGFSNLPNDKAFPVIFIYLAGTYALSWLSYEFCEKLFLRLRDHSQSKNAPQARMAKRSLVE